MVIILLIQVLFMIIDRYIYKSKSFTEKKKSLAEGSKQEREQEKIKKQLQ